MNKLLERTKQLAGIEILNEWKTKADIKTEMINGKKVSYVVLSTVEFRMYFGDVGAQREYLDDPSEFDFIDMREVMDSASDELEENYPDFNVRLSYDFI